jgi:23S rRNA pseudouridine1911/1915/1917 synthase
MSDFTFTATSEVAGERLDAAISKNTGRPRGVVQAAIRQGLITVSGESAKPSYRLVEGDVVSGEIEDQRPEQLPEAEDIPVHIRYSDDRVMVIYKPPGLVVHPGSGTPGGTLVNALLSLGGPLSQVDPLRPGIVHRLDKDTSGLLMVARDDEAHIYLSSALQRREVKRTYLVLVRGAMPAVSGTIEAPVGRHPTHRHKMAVTGEGRDAITHYRVLGEDKRCSYLEVSLETGRTHQIRVHMSHLKHPVLGDPVYGGRSELARELGLQRPFLHATRISFPHPDDGRVLEFTEPLPEDLSAVLERSGLVTNS